MICHMSQDFRGESVNFGVKISLPNSSEINTGDSIKCGVNLAELNMCQVRNVW